MSAERKVTAVAKKIVVTRAQKAAAAAMVSRREKTGRVVSESSRKIANATLVTGSAGPSRTARS